MDPLQLRHRTRNPEAILQSAFVDFLKDRSWHVMPTHGNAAQKGFPDLYCTHKQYGQRWIEMKNPESYSFTEAQLENFPKINAAGVGIWIIIMVTQAEYLKLFDKKYIPAGNWEEYLRAMLMLGSRAYKDRAMTRKRTCICGCTYMLRSSEHVTCTCTRLVRGRD